MVEMSYRMLQGPTPRISLSVILVTTAGGPRPYPSPLGGSVVEGHTGEVNYAMDDTSIGLPDRGSPDRL
jgi:hypothetical protein